MLQRRLGVGYVVASDMMAALRAAGMVGDPIEPGGNLCALRHAGSDRASELVEDLHSRLISATAYAKTDSATSQRSLAQALGTCRALRKFIMANT